MTEQTFRWLLDAWALMSDMPPGTPFTTDVFDDPPGLPRGHTIMGLMKLAQDEGLIRKTETRVRSARPQARGRRVSIWERRGHLQVVPDPAPVPDERILLYLNSLIGAIPKGRVLRHHSLCYQEHPQCALKAVRLFVEREAQRSA